MELGKNGYIKQTVIFINIGNNDGAYNLAKEFVQKFPDEMIAHYLLAKAASALKKYDEGAIEAHKAFNMSADKDDMIACAVVAAAAYLEMGNYSEGLEILTEMKKMKTHLDIEQLILVFSLAMNDDAQAVKQLETIYDMDKKATEELLKKMGLL